MDPDASRTLAAVLLCGAGGFQVALAGGAPWGSAAYGGGHRGGLPARLRRTSAVAACGYALAAVAVAREPFAPQTQRRVEGGLAGLFLIGGAANAASRSTVERLLWTPVSGALAYALWRSRPGIPT
jgi:hypothetical protein